jgi:hypothetical protein
MTNGVTWAGRGEPLTDLTSKAPNYIEHANGQFIAAYNGGNSLARSTDGINWSYCGAGLFSTGANCVAYGKDGSGNGLWVAVGSSGIASTTGNSIATSTDGITWTGRGATSLRSPGVGVAYGKDGSGNGLWVAVGGYNANTIATSTDGINWTSRGSTTFTLIGQCVAYGKDSLGNGLWLHVDKVETQL